MAAGPSTLFESPDAASCRLSLSAALRLSESPPVLVRRLSPAMTQRTRPGSPQWPGRVLVDGLEAGIERGRFDVGRRRVARVNRCRCHVAGR